MTSSIHFSDYAEFIQTCIELTRKQIYFKAYSDGQMEEWKIVILVGIK